ncbi:MAG: AAC(3) family N-acetyltransferase, partial [Candidatus Hydrogenedentes bacterium]|nr:AAC(3) family N-acetyltransferase [Candidatus Hydrogenedentota bacterium]
DSNTTFHTAEELAAMPYVSYPGRHDASVVDADGKSMLVRSPIHRWDRPRCFESWNDALVSADIVRCGNVGTAPCRLMESKALTEWLVALLRRNPRGLLAHGTPHI